MTTKFSTITFKRDGAEYCPFCGRGMEGERQMIPTLPDEREWCLVGASSKIHIRRRGLAGCNTLCVKSPTVGVDPCYPTSNDVICKNCLRELNKGELLKRSS